MTETLLFERFLSDKRKLRITHIVDNHGAAIEQRAWFLRRGQWFPGDGLRLPVHTFAAAVEAMQASRFKITGEGSL